MKKHAMNNILFGLYPSEEDLFIWFALKSSFEDCLGGSDESELIEEQTVGNNIVRLFAKKSIHLQMCDNGNDGCSLEFRVLNKTKSDIKEVSNIAQECGFYTTEQYQKWADGSLWE